MMMVALCASAVYAGDCYDVPVQRSFSTPARPVNVSPTKIVVQNQPRIVVAPAVAPAYVPPPVYVAPRPVRYYVAPPAPVILPSSHCHHHCLPPVPRHHHHHRCR